MNKIAKEVLKKLNDNGFESYIVGGYVRDLLLGTESRDIDICTNAKPIDFVPLFNGKANGYGSLNIQISDYNIDITTFREEYDYYKRKPKNIIYISDLKRDLQRRDFTINTICMDLNGKILDFFHGVDDLNKRIIRVVGNPMDKMQEDPLRILRAIRFATILDFTIEEELDKFLLKWGSLVKDLSLYRVKEEIEKILVSPYFQKGVTLLQKYHLDQILNLSFSSVVFTSDVCGMWAQISYPDDFPFTKNEKETIVKIREILNFGCINNEILYQYGLYLSLVAGNILGISSQFIQEMYQKIPISSRKDLNISYLEIVAILGINPSKEAKRIEQELLFAVLNGKVENTKPALQEYLKVFKERRIQNE